MKVAIHQPQYIPWLPYFLKIQNSDLFIFLDNVSFQKNGIQNRNKIKTSQGAQWLTVPVIQKLGQEINETPINNKVNWRHKHWQAIKQCYGKTSGFLKHQKELEDIYLTKWSFLGELNIELTKLMMKWMDINTKVLKSSELHSKGKASDLVLNLCLEVEADIYVSGTGAVSYLNQSQFLDAGVSIEYNPVLLPSEYPQQNAKQGFINDLSALDILFNCDENWKTYPLDKMNKYSNQ
jgi:hypothetical protein